MRQIIFYFSLCSLFLFAFCSCKNASKAPLLAAQIFVRYSQDSGDMRTEARFENAAGEMLTLVEAPTLNENPLHQMSVDGAVYTFAGKTRFQEKNTLSWLDPNGSKQSYAVQVGAIQTFSIKEEPIQTGKMATLIWDGVRKLKAEDHIVFLWEKEGQTVTMEATGPTDNNSLMIPASEMGRLSAGTWSLYLVYKQRFVQKTPLIANLDYEFYSPSRTFEIH